MEEGDGMLDKRTYLDVFGADCSSLATVVRRDPQVALPSCPGWTAGRLLAHLGAIFISITRNIREGQGEDIVNTLDDLQLRPDYMEWFRHEFSLELMPSTVVEWFENIVSQLHASFSDTDPAERTWTWHPSDQTVGFWIRRMTHESAIHRWDAQLPYGEPDPIAHPIAGDGVDEALSVYQPVVCRSQSKVQGSGENYHFHQIDGDGEWVVRFEGMGMQVSREHVKCDVAIRGTGSDLMLFLWHRIPMQRLQVLGEHTLVARYFDLVPPD